MIIELEQKKLDEKFAAVIDASILSDEQVDEDNIQQQHHGFVETPK